MDRLTTLLTHFRPQVKSVSFLQQHEDMPHEKDTDKALDEKHQASQKRVLEVKPGITDYASIEYFNENALLAEAQDPKKAYVETIMPEKIRLNQKYISNPTLAHDLKIIFRTILRILKN